MAHSFTKVKRDNKKRDRAGQSLCGRTAGAVREKAGDSGSAEKPFEQDEENLCKISCAEQLVKGDQSRQHGCVCSFPSFRVAVTRFRMDTAERASELQENSGTGVRDAKTAAPAAGCCRRKSRFLQAQRFTLKAAMPG